MLAKPTTTPTATPDAPARPITILDGGMGRELMRMGAPFRQPEWSALALTEGPDWVVQAHKNFIAAGAEVITTNSYAIVPFHIGEARFASSSRALAALCADLARKAVADSGKSVRIAASLPPLFGSYRPDLWNAAEAPRIIDELIEGLAPEADIWLGETLSAIAEARCVRDGLDRHGSAAAKPLWIAYTLDDYRFGALRSGELVADAVKAAVDLGAEAVLFNCSQSEAISAAMPLARAAAGGQARIGGYANRFVAAHGSTGEANEQLAAFRDDLDPPAYGDVVEGWTRDGATILGGCCGMTPNHIRALATRFGAKSAAAID